MSTKRCNCGHGECWDCYRDGLDELLISDPDYRDCSCGMDCCGVCNYYKSIDKYIPRIQDENEH